MTKTFFAEETGFPYHITFSPNITRDLIRGMMEIAFF